MFETRKTQIPGFVGHTGVTEHVACAYKTRSEALLEGLYIQIMVWIMGVKVLLHAPLVLF